MPHDQDQPHDHSREHGAGHGSGEHSGHSHADRDEALLARSFAIIAAFMIVEVVGALYANSLTLLADAGHMFLDASALGLSWYAARASRRDSDHQLSYGYHRMQVLAAFVNALALLALATWILFEAAGRLRAPEPMLPLPALAVASVGLVVNIVVFRMLHGSLNLNVRSAALHVLGDLLGSVAAIAAAAAVLWFAWSYADPILAMVIVGILVKGAYGLLKESSHILLEGVPTHLNIAEIGRTLAARVAGVTEVHHIHAWALTPEKPLLTLHATVDDPLNTERIVSDIKAVLLERFGIDHSTVQIERGECPDD